MKKKVAKTDTFVFNYLALAHSDYLVSRHLLIDGFLEHGAMLASTAVEKYLKAIIGIHGISRGEHLCGTLYKFLKQCQPALFSDLDIDFIKFLEKSFKLRYASVSSPGLAIVINQYRTLIALDATIAKIDKGFVFKDKRGNLETHFRSDVKKNNPYLTKENVELDKQILPDVLRKNNKVLELKIEDNLTTFAVSYETDGVSLEGSFLKIPELSMSKTTSL